MKLKNGFISAFFLFFVYLNALSTDTSRVLRFPTIYNDHIVFSYAGDLYQVESKGGIARKLTSHKGYEMFPKFSPDGSKIAFTAQYDGNTEVYVMPADGGIPARLTYTATLGRDKISDRMGPNNIVMTWTPDGKHIIYRSRQNSFNSFRGHLFKVPAVGGLSKRIPLSEGGFCSYSPDGKKLAFNRVFREFRTWKHYRGGMADDLWIFNIENKSVEQITHNNWQDIIPMWHNNTIYYLSDEDFRMNLYSYNLDTKVKQKLTEFKTYDIKFPSKGADNIVFENGGYIYKYNLNNQKLNKVAISISNDQVHARNEWKDASEHIFNSDISPCGKRVIFSARGDLFSVAAEKGITYNLTSTPGVHERDAVWSPDGRYIAYISDLSGEDEIYIRNPEKGEDPIKLTTNGDTYKYYLKWSPDSKKILWTDRKLRLQYVNIKTKETVLVKQATHSVIRDFNWSPDSKWIAYENQAYNAFNKIHIFNSETEKDHLLTTDFYHYNDPVFSKDGNYLLFSSARTFSPSMSEIEWNYAYFDMSKIYLVTLKQDTPNPFAPVNERVLATSENDKEEKNSNDEPVTVDIDFDGIMNRLIELPVEPSNYYNLQMADNKVFYYEISRLKGHSNMKMFDLNEKKETNLGKNISFTIAWNGKKMLVKQNNKYAVIDIPSSKVSFDKTVSLEGMQLFVNYNEEWEQIFNESWRQMRDFFYIPNMNGFNWNAIRNRYAKWVPYVKHRDDLTYVIGEMIAELNAGHAYVQSGDRPKAKQIKTGLLGAELERHSSGYYKINKILDGKNWNDKTRSPLQQVGIQVDEGEFIIAIDGADVSGSRNIYKNLVGKANKIVELTINSTPKASTGRKVLIKTIDDESPLYYHEWVQGNIRKVDSISNGDVGYLHIPDMTSTGLNEFVEYYYPQIRKKGLIIDVRGNGGGNVSPIIIERLRREINQARMTRNVPVGEPRPRMTFMGAMVMLADKYTASDGDIIAHSFKKHNLGPVIGTRTWGGVIGIGGSLPFVDGADLRKPESATYSAEESKWILENHGVEPDIVVDNDPYKEYIGKDKQLQKAIEVVMDRIKDEYKPVPPVPKPPDRSGK
jgi:tricorn protease